MNHEGTCELAHEPATWKMAGWLFVLLACLYLLTGSKLYFGYEGWNIAQAEAIVAGTLTHQPDGRMEPWTQGGVLEVAVYLPGAMVKRTLEPSGKFPGLRQLIHMPVQPLTGALIGVTLFFLALELFQNRRTALGVALIAATGTMLWPYSKFGMEQQQTFWMLVGLIGLARYRRRGCAGGAVTLGVAIAMVMLTKVTGVLVAASLAGCAGWLCVREGWLRRPGAAKHAAVVAVCAALGLAVLLATNHWRYGHWSLVAGRYAVDVETDAAAPLFWSLWALAASPGKSLLLYSPPLVIVLWFGFAFFRRFGWLRMFALCCAAMVLFHIRMYTWADETWGVRRLHWLIPLAALPLGCWLESLRAMRAWVRWLGWAGVGLGVAVQLLAVAFDYTEHAKALGFRDIYYVQNNVWVPEFSPVRFNMLLLRSNLQRNRDGGDPAYWVIHPRYIQATKSDDPQQVLAPRALWLGGHDQLDLWYLQHPVHNKVPYWESSLSTWGVLLLMAGLVMGTWGLRQACKNETAASSDQLT